MKIDEGYYYNGSQKAEFLISYIAVKDDFGNPVKDEFGDYVFPKSKFERSRSVLHKLKKYEDMCDKDFCYWDSIAEENIIDMMYGEWFNNVSNFTSRMDHAVLKAYISWCRQNEIITPLQSEDHPFMSWCQENYSMRGELYDAAAIRSSRVNNGIEHGVNPKSDYIFATENEFFDYISTIFEDDKYVMYATICCLIYYGFSSEEAMLIRRDDVDEYNKTVCGRLIDNDTAFDIICRAKHADKYVVQTRNRLINKQYANGPYLIRTDRKDSMVNPVPLTFAMKLPTYQRRAEEELPPDSKYNGIQVKLTTIRKLRTFYIAAKDQRRYGIDYTASKFKNGDYGSTLEYLDYRMMSARIENK